MTEITPTASDVEGLPRSIVFPEFVASTVLCGGADITGDVLSAIVTRCVSCATFPDASVAVQITIVMPSGNFSGALLLSKAIPLASVAVA